MRNDINELFTDIDDDLIADAMPEAQRPVEMKADTRHFSWKKFAAAAACLAVVVVGGTFALKAVSGRGGLVSSENANSDNLNPGGSTVSEPASAGYPPEYPEEAKYQYTGDFSELELCQYACVEREGYRSFDELVDNSDLIVVGTFVDDAWQNRPTDRLSYQSSWGASYNKLRIDRVFYGEAEVGSEIVISDNYFVTDGQLMYIASYTLTPMIKGEQWVYFLGKVSPEYGNYYYPLYTEGRYPVPGNENSFVLTDSHYNEDIYADVKKMLGSEPSSAGYPIEAKYQYTGDFSELELYQYADAERYEYQSVDDLLEHSDLVVVGTFVDDAWQNRPTDGVLKNFEESDEASFNKLRIDRVFYGDAEVGEEIVIANPYLVTDGKLMYIGNDSLTPMIKGEQWVYFLKHQLPGHGDYYLTAWTDGRYPVPGNENTFVLTGDSTHGVFDEKYFREDIYEDVKKMLGDIGGVEKIERGDQTATKEFTMPEFPGDKFIWKEKELLVSHNGETASVMYKTTVITSLYLADTNGDGKRELIAACPDDWTEQSASFIAVYDHANKKLYPHRPGANKSYDLEMKDNELYVVTKTLDNGKEISAEPLMVFLAKNPLITNKPEFNDKTHVEKIECEDWTATKEFTMPEFPGDKFTWKKDEMLVSHGGETAVALYGAPNIISVYLTDLNGDGKRELVNLCWNGLSGLSAEQLMVYDYANSKYYTLKTDTTTLFNNELEIRGNELYVITQILGDYEAISSQPLTFDMLEPITRCGLDNPESDDKTSTHSESNPVEEIVNFDWATATTKEFTIPEFPEDKFIWKENKLSVLHDGTQTASVLYDSICIPSVYLSDLNGDGKRELIAVCLDDLSEMPMHFIRVYDYANKKVYPFRPVPERSFDLEMWENELYVVTTTIGDDEKVSSVPLWYFLRNSPLITNNQD